MPSSRAIEIGARLRDARVQAKLSLAEVANELKVSRQSVSFWETGQRRLDVERLGELVLLYGVSADFILFGTHMVPHDLKDLFARMGR